MHLAIKTKHLGATSRQCLRVKAFLMGYPRHSVVINYDPACNLYHMHWLAAEKLAAKHNYKIVDVATCGDEGYVFIVAEELDQ